MAIPVLIIGDSGSGKTTSLRNIPPENALLVQSIDKRLPFRAKGWAKATRENPNGSIVVTDNYAKLHRILNKATETKDIIIFDDANYLMQNEEMRRVEETGYKKFTQQAKAFWELIDHAQKLPNDARVYFMMHTQTDASGFIKPKTTGKMLDEKIVIEGLFTIVFRCMTVDGKHMFTTETNGNDPVKTPMEMFNSYEIDNDLFMVDNAIKQYYNLG